MIIVCNTANFFWVHSNKLDHVTSQMKIALQTDLISIKILYEVTAILLCQEIKWNINSS